MINPEGIAGRIYQLNVWMRNKLTKRQPTGRRAPAELLSGEVGPVPRHGVTSSPGLQPASPT